MKIKNQIYYTMPELMNILQMTRPTIQKEIENGKIIAHRMGGRIRFREDNIQKYIDSCEQK